MILQKNEFHDQNQLLLIHLLYRKPLSIAEQLVVRSNVTNKSFKSFRNPFTVDWMRSIIRESWFLFITVHYWQKEIFKIPSHQLDNKEWARPRNRFEWFRKTFSPSPDKLKLFKKDSLIESNLMSSVLNRGTMIRSARLGWERKIGKNHFTAWLFDLVKWF